MLDNSGSPRVHRFLVTGYGSIGHRHLSNLKALGVTDMLAVDVRDDSRKEVEEELGIQTYGDLPTALQQGAGVALVCTPNNYHFEHALAAAQAGCHLFIEKPISDTLEGLDRLVDELQQRQLVSLVGCNFRFEPGLRQVKKLLEQRVVGRVISARAQFGQYLPDWHPWEDYRKGYSARRELGGGVVLDRVHEIDYMRWLLGEVIEVSAMTGHLSHLEIDTEDTAEILLRFKSGVLGSIHLDYVNRVYDSSLEIVGDGGSIKWNYQDHNVSWYIADDGQWHSLRWPNYQGNEMYLRELEHFLRVLDYSEEAELDAAGARRVLSIALAAKQRAADRVGLQVE